MVEFDKNVSSQEFLEKCFYPEVPCIVHEVAEDWPARTKWTQESVIDALSRDPDVVSIKMWWETTTSFLRRDYTVPNFVRDAMGFSHLRPTPCRFWLVKQGHNTKCHYDGNWVFVFNVQVQGCKRWSLVSPDTPFDHYAFSRAALPRQDFSNRSVERFTTKEGDMVFVPPLWSHYVTALEDSINFNWVGTKTGFHPSVLAEREREILKLWLMGKSEILKSGDLSRQYFEGYGGVGRALIESRATGVSEEKALERFKIELQRECLPSYREKN